MLFWCRQKFDFEAVFQPRQETKGGQLMAIQHQHVKWVFIDVLLSVGIQFSVFCYCFSVHTAPLNFNLNMMTVGMLLIVLFLSGELFYI